MTAGQPIAAYLDAWLEDGTPEELRNALATVARSRGISDPTRRRGIKGAGWGGS